jgi:hypothetical protein
LAAARRTLLKALGGGKAQEEEVEVGAEVWARRTLLLKAGRRRTRRTPSGARVYNILSTRTREASERGLSIIIII